MNLRLERLATRFDSLVLRERVAVFAAVAVVVVFLANLLIIEPQSRNMRQMNQSVKEQSMQLKSLQDQIKVLQQAGSTDLDSLNRERLQKAQEQLSQLEVELDAAQKGLVSAERMPALLQDVLRQQPGLQLVELRTLPVTALVDRSGQKDEKSPKTPGDTAAPGAGGGAAFGPERNLYKHGFEVTVRGNYLDFIQYLAQLERLPTRMYWSKVTMNADEFPRVTLTATIFTLSLEKAWLAV
jgi:MSHA biogenesis protein MshJ